LMARSLNKVMLIGNLGKDPEIRNSQDGSKFANFTLATTETWNDSSSGEKKERTEWHRVVVFNQGLAELCEKYLKKGQKVYVEGQLQTRKYNDAQGAEKYATEIVLGKFRGEITMLSAPNNGGAVAYADGSHAEDSKSSSMVDDDIPF